MRATEESLCDRGHEDKRIRPDSTFPARDVLAPSTQRSKPLIGKHVLREDAIACCGLLAFALVASACGSSSESDGGDRAIQVNLDMGRFPKRPLARPMHSSASFDDTKRMIVIPRAVYMSMPGLMDEIPSVAEWIVVPLDGGFIPADQPSTPRRCFHVLRDTVVAMGGLLILGGVLIAVTGVFGRLGKLRINHFAGFRTRTTMASDEAWLAAHRAGGLPLAFGGVVVVALGLFALAATDPDVFGPIAAIVVLAFVVPGAVLAQRAARVVNETRASRVTPESFAVEFNDRRIRATS